MPAMLDRNPEVPGKRRGRTPAGGGSSGPGATVHPGGKSLSGNGTNMNSCWEERSSGSSSDEEHGGGGMRVGPQYQAVVPDFDPVLDVCSVPVDEYIAIAKEKHGYNMEQALGMLFWHKHNIERSLADLPNFTPFPDEWTVEDRVLFEQAFSFHGKSFHRIQQMLPDKSMASLVRFYYSWKKTRSKTSLMDRQTRKQKRERDDSDEELDDSNGNPPSDSELNPTKDDKKESGGKASQRVKKRPPRGMFLNQQDVVSLSSSSAQGLIRQLDGQLGKAQSNCQFYSMSRPSGGTVSGGRVKGQVNQKFNSRWTTEEQLLAVQAIRKYGRDFQAISDVIGNKSVVQVKNFLVNYRRRFNLDEVLLEWEAEHGVEGGTTGDEDKMEVGPAEEEEDIVRETKEESSSLADLDSQKPLPS
ncbi:hypothetical protein PAMP_005438 [Pampus punctatissimus]